MTIPPEALEELLADPSHPAWSSTTPMPPWLTSFRDHQVDAVDRIVDAFTRTNHVILDAPVGSGKSLIADLVRRALDTRSIYTCTTKTLQDQLEADFPHAAVLKGRANYPTQSGGFPEINAGDCTKSYPGDECNWCDDPPMCGYSLAKRAALASHTAVLNTAYFLTEANGPGAMSGRGFVVIDEAAELESALMGFVEVEVTQYWRDKLGIDMPQVKTEKAKSNDWQEWAEDALYRVNQHLQTLHPEPANVKATRYRKRTANLASKLSMLVQQLPEGGWVYDGYNRRKPTALFRPIMVDNFAEQFVWRHGEKFLLMDGAVISPDEMADSLGIEDYEPVTVDVDWDPSRRPFYVTPVANVTYKTKDEAYPELAKAMSGIMDAHPGERILVHTVSYHLARYLHEEVAGMVDRPVMVYTNAEERAGVLQAYKDTDGAVLFAPSMDRGVDFKDDLARVVVIAKCPYPSLGDKQIKTRANMGRRGRVWYATQVCRNIVQMIGRGMRHEDDWCVVYAIDDQLANNVSRRYKRMLPRWVRETLVFEDRPWEGQG